MSYTKYRRFDAQFVSTISGDDGIEVDVDVSADIHPDGNVDLVEVIETVNGTNWTGQLCDYDYEMLAEEAISHADAAREDAEMRRWEVK
ncbi:MAG: hypothetical protein Unbinned1322contig1001_17 [Prokaryotic dsDNA virus sp.]|nr:MAG: hypothetical protein Unbinned1322contig1001_17 [Prokaryotic dsDNA virus sp.]|tara:strand:+ start:24194 stop:24460 length:267 start_codon:yes stop_codon:yes gene_type:complete